MQTLPSLNKKNIFSFFILLLLLIIPLTTNNKEQLNLTDIVTADVAWMLSASALVLIMTPGLAFFYGGMVSKKNVISTMLQSFVCMAIVTTIWVFIGFSLAFGTSIYGIIGNPFSYPLMQGVLSSNPISTAPTIPFVLFAFFQLKFAIITPALITGAFAERIRFNSYVLFIILFVIFIYTPLAHMTWHPDGLLFKNGVLDFAGGTVVHMSAGWGALACALYLKKRNEPIHQPARITYVLLGTGLLWFGWIGFNAGSAYSASSLAVLAFATTSTSSASAALAWFLFDILKGKLPGAMGLCIAAVVGLVAITPGAGYVSIQHSIFIGAFSAIISNIMISLRSKTNIDDSLDVFPGHGIGGIMGMLLTGVFANQALNPANTTGNGLFFGETKLFFTHLFVLIAVSLFCFFGTKLLLSITNFISPLRVNADDEKIGLDISQHNERL